MSDGVLPGLGALLLHLVERVVAADVQVDVEEGQHPVIDLGCYQVRLYRVLTAGGPKLVLLLLKEE